MEDAADEFGFGEGQVTPPTKSNPSKKEQKNSKRKKKKKKKKMGPRERGCRSIMHYTSYLRTKDCTNNGYVTNMLEHNIDTGVHMISHNTQT